MAKILKKLPKREHGKYFKTGFFANIFLSNINSVMNNFVEKDNEQKKQIQQAALVSCIEISYSNANGLNTFQNAEITGLTQNLNDEQIKILEKISNNTELARILFATGKCSGYIMLVLMLGTLYIQGQSYYLYNLIQPGETFMFIGVAITAAYCMIKQETLAEKVKKQIQQLVNINEAKNHLISNNNSNFSCA